MKLSICLLLVLVISGTSTIAAKLPNNFEKCNRNDPDFNQCLTKAVNDAIHQLTKPVKEVGLPSLEPLVIPSMTIGAGTGPVNLQQKYKNVELHGYSTMAIDKFNVDFEKKTAILNGVFPELTLKAQYEVNGKILLLPVFGNGPVTITLKNLEGTNWFTLDEYEKNGKKYFKVVKSKVKLVPEMVHFKFENLFNGDKALGDNINQVINDNWKEVFDDVKSGYEEVFAQINLGLANDVFSRVPIRELFE